MSRRLASTAGGISVTVFGLLVSFAAVEHGVGELLQGHEDPASLMIRSWPDSPAFAPLDGEPAMTILPGLRLSGILTVGLAIVLAGWVVGFAHRRSGGPVLVALSLLLLVVGGGLAPPLMGVVLGVTTMLQSRPGHRPAGALARALSRFWVPLLATTVAGYLGLFPGVVLLNRYTGVDSTALVALLAAVSFTGFLLTLIAAHGRGILDR